MSNINLESYPPLFRLLHHSHSPSRQPPPPPAEQDDPIPVIDFQALIAKNDNDNNNTTKARLAEACGDWGLFRLVNHGVPSTLLSRLQDEARELFSMSFEAKKGLFSSTPLSYFWGTPALTPSGAALSRGPQNINWVEGLNVPLSQLSQIQPHHHQNPTLASFGALVEEYGKHLGRLGRAIFEAISEKLNIVESIESYSNLSESTGLIRVYRYPPYDDEENGDEGVGAWGMDVHTDSSVMSILNQDQVGGLQVLKDNKWFSVKPLSDTLIVNLGDMMQAISDDEYKSVKHRVKVNKSKERVSICYFVFPGEGSVIRSSKYRPFTYSDFQAQVQRDIKAFGYKVGLERFKLRPTNTAKDDC